MKKNININQQNDKNMYWSLNLLDQKAKKFNRNNINPDLQCLMV